ncbi:Nif3-like dinuclear metal center hexameric protein [candidate division KSB1 bacterium]|nr:Nif3-like dinuclear metal center hexameric protein [candidate division KSB1 bacterium]MBL7094773.1 Nif3-like dinuclear metal center hexameric protein [candidate division KSB1 bacterium]
MANRDEILNYLNDLLNVTEFDDYCVNGMQVEGKEDVKKIVLGVSVSQRLFQQAIEKNADMILVHHGIFWKSDAQPFSLTGIFRERLALLLKNDINLLAYHLPLDAHPEFGNNAMIMKKLNIKPIKPVEIGFLGELKTKIKWDEFINQINEKIETESQVFHFGTEYVQKVLILSGGSSRYYFLTKENGADVFIGGDIKENIVRELEETNVNYINAWHYNTEKFGVQALVEIITKKFAVRCEFIDIPNPV